MKQYLAIILSSFYLFLATGINLNLHYCHGEIDSISLFEDEGTCGCHNGEEPIDCCSDENYKYEVQSEQFVSVISTFNFKLFGEKIIHHFNPSIVSWISKTELKRSNSPPLLAYSKVPTRILLSNFRL